MENTTTPMENTTPATPSSGGARGAFLTVICILTFIGSGFGILGDIFSYATADTHAAITSEAVSQMDDQQNTPSFFKQMMGSMTDKMTAENIKKSSLFGLLSCLLTLFGAIMMFRQKKAGFFMYLAGIIIYIIAPLIVLGGLFGIASVMMAGVIGLAFVIMYAVNLKYMTK